MKTIPFTESNITFKPPGDLEESQCHSCPAYVGNVKQGSVEGLPMVVVCWQPDERERDLIARGQPIFLSMIGGGLPPHFLTTSFQEATNPA